MYILVKLNVSTHFIKAIFKSDNKEYCLSKLYGIIKDEDENRINTIEDDNQVVSYKKNRGYIYDVKVKQFCYQILDLTDIDC